MGEQEMRRLMAILMARDQYVLFGFVHDMRVASSCNLAAMSLMVHGVNRVSNVCSLANPESTAVSPVFARVSN